MTRMTEERIPWNCWSANLIEDPQRYGQIKSYTFGL